MNKKTNNEVNLKDSDNYEGLMPNNNDEFRMLVRNKAVKSFANAESHSRPIKLDLLLTKLYLAL